MTARVSGKTLRAADIGFDTWLVLGGGGMKGMAHVGAWRWLRERGTPLGGLIGCSIGALVAACIAAGLDVSTMYRIARRLERSDIIRVNRRAAWVNGLKAESVFQARPLRDFIASILPVHRWEQLRHPLQVNAVDLANGTVEWFGTGARTDVSVVDAVYASSALPVFYPPAEIGGRYYVDGGVEQALPMDRCEALGASGVLAVDCGAGAEADAEDIVERGMVAIHQRVMSIMIRRRRMELASGWHSLPKLVIRPNLDGYDTFDFDSIPYFLEEGYRSAREALPDPRA